MSRKFGFAVLLWCAAGAETALASVADPPSKPVDVGERSSVAVDNRRTSLIRTDSTECDRKSGEPGALTKLLHRAMGADRDPHGVQCPLPDREEEQAGERSDEVNP